MAEWWMPLLLSLRVAAGALVVVALTGTAAARVMTRSRPFPGRALLEALFLLPLVLPPVVTGYALLVLLSRQGQIGRVLDGALGVRLVFTLAAAIIAAAIIAFPLMYQSAKAAFRAVDPQLEDAARSLGAREGRVFFRIALPLAWPGLAAGMVLAFARALGEFGATVLVAGNIPGRTQTAALAIYALAEAGDLRAAGAYALALSAVCLVLVWGMEMRGRRAASG